MPAHPDAPAVERARARLTDTQRRLHAAPFCTPAQFLLLRWVRDLSHRDLSRAGLAAEADRILRAGRRS